MSVFFTSDLHLGHEKVAKIRGFETTEAHDAAIAEMWASTVRAGDIVHVLGDVTANASAKVLTPAIHLLRQLPGRKRLYLGNHDGAHPMYRDAYKHSRTYAAAFEHVSTAGRIRVEGREVALSHFPYERDRDVARHMQWRLRDEGLPLLHGHTHGDETLVENVDMWGGTTRVEIHVGLDAWGLKLVPLETIAALLSTPYTKGTK